MFNKKPRRNFRQRRESSSEEDGQQQDSREGGDTDGPPPVVNKPSKLAPGRGICCSSKPDLPPVKPDSSDGEDAETLRVTATNEERGKEKDTGKNSTTTVLSFSDDKEAGEPTFKLKKCSDKAVLFQVRRKEASSDKTAHSPTCVPSSASPRQDSDSQSSPHSLQYNVDDSDTNDDDGTDDDNESDKYGARSPLTSSASDYSCSSVTPVVIPNPEEILAAKRQRRATRAQKEFIPLGRDGQSSAGSTPGHYSREDEEDSIEGDDEPDDHERRIEFAPRLKSIRERIAEKLGGSDGSLSCTDEEEQELWEETQIEKGVKRHQGEQSPSGSESSSSSSRRGRGRQKKRAAGARIPKTLPPVSISMVKKRITGKLESLKEVHRARQAELRRMEGDVESAKTSVETLNESSSERQLKFYRDMTLYVHNLLECLQEKVVEINSLELELHTLLSDQMEALLSQRRQKVKEQADCLQQLSYGTVEQNGSSADGTETKSATSTAAIAEDDFSVFEDTQPSAEEEEQLQKKIADVMLRSQTVFSDVQDDFSDIKKILSRFEEWRGSYSESYHSAYISLCLPKLLNPIIRHQLLAWNPLKDAIEDFENLPWFRAVETFCYGHGHEELELIDRQTLSNVIEKTVLSKITAFVELVWDPMSCQQSVCLSDVCHKLKEDYSIFEGEESKPIKAFKEAVIRRMRRCVDEDVFIPLYPKKFLEDKSSPQSRFREHQIEMAIKLLGNIGKWDLLLAETSLKELMLDKLLNRYLMITLCNQTPSSNTNLTCKKIADSLPLSWFKGVNVCLPQLQNFENYLVQRVHSICRESPGEPNDRSAVVELLQVLSKIRCNDSIMAIAEKYHYQDVIYSYQLLNQETD